MLVDFFNTASFLLLLVQCITNAPLQPDQSDTVSGEIIQEVPFGKTVAIHCHSNDANHNFLFWQLPKENHVVGPGNKFDDSKYNYQVLTGDLIINLVSVEEEGIYNCVSRGVRKDDYNIRSVRMVVQKDWEEVFESDATVNTFRVIIVIGAAFIVMAGLYMAYKIRKSRPRLETLLESDDEDNEEIFRAPGTSKSTGNIVLDSSKSNFDKDGFDTDFGHMLSNSQN